MENIIKNTPNVEAVKVSEETKDLLKCVALLDDVYSFLEDKIIGADKLDRLFKLHIEMLKLIQEEISSSFIEKMEETNFKEV